MKVTWKDLITAILLVAVGWLMFFKEDEQAAPIDYDELREIHLENERRFLRDETLIKQLENEIHQDSIFVHSATDEQLDSLESRYNPE